MLSVARWWRSIYLRLSPELEPYVLVLRGTRFAAPFDADPLAPSAWRLTLTTAGMVAAVNSVVTAACARLALEALGVDSLAIPLASGAVIGAGAFFVHHRHHRRARDAFRPESVDRAAIVAPPSQQAGARMVVLLRLAPSDRPTRRKQRERRAIRWAYATSSRDD